MEKTCANCPNLKIKAPKRLALAYCGKTDLAVPHGWDGEEFHFSRIPLTCPRNDVNKSEKSLPFSKWEKKTYEELSDE